MARKTSGKKVLSRGRRTMSPASGLDNIRRLIMTLLHSVTNVHVMHLQSKSFSEHMALGAYYTAVDKHVDSLVEAYQGHNDLVMDYPMQNDYKGGMTPVEYMKYVRGEVVSRRKSFPGSELQNIMDTIIELIDSTLYKLRFLH